VASDLAGICQVTTIQRTAVLDRGKRLARGFAFTYASHPHEAGRARLRELACWVALAAARERQAERPSEKNPQEKKMQVVYSTERTAPSWTSPNVRLQVPCRCGSRLAEGGGLVVVRKSNLKRAASPSPGRNQPPPPPTTWAGRGPPIDLIRARQP
jgi:hypothetical protein